MKKQRNVAAEKKKYFEEVMKVRGFRFGLHQIHAEADWEFIKKFEEWVRFIYLSDRHLDRRVKELVITGILCALRSPPPHIKTHMNKAVEAGATREEIIVVAELAGHWGGTVAQANALEAWRLQFAPELPGIFEPMGQPPKSSASKRRRSAADRRKTASDRRRK